MVSYIRSDLEFILQQIKIAEDHTLYVQSGGTQGRPLFGTANASIPSYNIAWGLRTVDGTYNHLLPGQENQGSSDQPFPEHLGTDFRTIMVDPDGDGPAGPVPVSYLPGFDNDGSGTAGPGDVIDPTVRTISNLIVDQTLSNPAAILAALERAGTPGDHMAIAAQLQALYAPVKSLALALDAAIDAAAEARAAADANPGNQALEDAAVAAEAERAEAQAQLDAASVPLNTALAANGIEMDGNNIVISNVAPDEGLSASFNSWFTLFGQFFDHGLDLVGKGGSGTVFIPLMPDDPLYVEGSDTNFMVLTRATVEPGLDGVLGTSDDVRPINTTTAFVDQNQTYASHASHQVFLRQYELNADGEPVATGKLIVGAGADGSRGTSDDSGMATWADVKAQAADLLGIQLVDSDVGNVPLLATDEYGNFIPGPNGYAQIVLAGNPPTLLEGDPAANDGLGVLVPANAVRTGHAFLADIAHNAVPEGLADGDIEIGLDNGDGQTDGIYDNELLDAHFMAGDGRANENIGLTAVHHVFHSEHNRLVDHTKAVLIQDANQMLADGASQAEAVAFLNEWLLTDVSVVPASPAGLVWDGERIFQAAKFGTEMQYQHLVFEEFARKVSPSINTFLVPDGFDTTLDPSIMAEFAHVVYRFGHSMLTESIDRFDPEFAGDHISLIEGFLNPLQFQNGGGTAAVDPDLAAGAIIRGMTRQVGNEIDEFVTSALRNNLLGLPLDLATINLARGRDAGVAALNAVRAQFYEASNQNVLLKPYESWVDYAGHLKNEASIINFIAAYGTHELIVGETTIAGKRAAAMAIIFGTEQGVDDNGDGTIDRTISAPADALDFLNGLGQYAGDLGGLNNVDLWIGGLAEEIMPFGGMLGSTFAYVFEIQLEKLQSGDRFYYLQRLDGLHLFGEMENNSFASMIMRNTDATHLPSDVFSTPGFILEVDPSKQYNDLNGDGTLEHGDPTGGGILTPLVIRNNPATTGADTNYLRYTGGDHVVLGGTDPGNAHNPSGNDILIAGIGDDTLYGDGGNDRLDGGFGNDIINGGAGDDIIVDAGGDDNIKAGDGNDVVHAGPGLDLVLAGKGNDFVFLGTDEGSEVFAGEGDDFVYGNKNAERILGNEGNDWIETGTFDGAPGDNFDEIFAHDGIDGHDVFLGDGGFDEFIGEGGDDIMVGSPGRGKMAGMSGWDWATYKDNTFAVNADLSLPIIFDEAGTPPPNAALDGYESMEGLSGTRFNDILRGTNVLADERVPGGTEGFAGSALDWEGVQLIAGLGEVMGDLVSTTQSYSAGDIILGGDGSDIITGQMGDDVIDGDKWLDVQIGVFAPGDVNHTGTPIALHNSMTTLAASMFNGSINPGQLAIVRTIRTADGAGDTDVAVFSDVRANYTITSNADGTISVAHVTVSDGLESDGVDRVRNIEVLRFADQDVSLTKPVVDLHAFDVGGTFQDNFSAGAYNASNGTASWVGQSWTETGDDGSATNATGQIQITGGNLRFDTGDGATITRTVPLAGAASARMTYQVNEQSLEANDNVLVQYSSDGTTWVTVDTIDNNTGSTTRNIDLPGPFTATSAIRFVASSLEGAGGGNTADVVDISSVAVEYTVPAPNDGLNYTTSYVENAAGVAIANRPNITDDGAALVSARIVLTNAQPGDDFDILGNLPAGITASTDLSVDGQITLNLTGTASLAAYRAAIAQVTFDSSSENPGNVARIVQITVNDGFVESDPVTTTINVTSVNDAPVAANDTVITNVAAGVSFSIAVSALLANDSDPEGSPVSITAVGGANGLSTPVLAAGAVTVSDTGGAGGSFTYTASDGSLTDPAIVNVTRVTGNITGGGASEIIIGNTAGTTISGGGGNDRIDAGDGGDTVTGGTGDDIVNAGTGNDTIVWNANANGDTDGYDRVDGSFGTDTFDVNTRTNTSETFRVYTRNAAIAAGLTDLGANTEIVITRQVGATTSVIAELDNVEEIRIGNQATDPVNGSAGPGDTVQIFGDFSETSLALNTITINGTRGDDTIDISGLTSDHRVVFTSNGGNDTVVGAREQDVIDLSMPDINGTRRADVLNGTDGADNIFGLGGNDNIKAGAGDDKVDGGAGADKINGGAGNDVMDGAGGNDRFVFTAGFGDDRIQGFDANAKGGGQDLLDISALNITKRNFAQEVVITDLGNDTLVTIGENSILLEGVDGVGNNVITQADFLLG